MSGTEDALGRAEDLLERLERTRARLESTQDPEAAIEILAELGDIARQVETELEQARREAGVAGGVGRDRSDDAGRVQTIHHALRRQPGHLEADQSGREVFVERRAQPHVSHRRQPFFELTVERVHPRRDPRHA